MYLVLLVFIALFVVISLFDRGVTGLALIGIVVLLVMLVKKVPADGAGQWHAS